MTTRERLSLFLDVTGLALLGWAAYAYDGWRAVALVIGVVILFVGILLGFDDGPAPLPDWADDGGPERVMQPWEQQPLPDDGRPLP